MRVARIVLCLDLCELLDLGLESQVSPLQILDELMLGLHHQDLNVEAVHFWLLIYATFASLGAWRSPLKAAAAIAPSLSPCD